MKPVDIICMPFFILMCWVVSVWLPYRMDKDEPSPITKPVRVVFGLWFLFIMYGIVWSAIAQWTQ